ncbi:MAG: biopolymer transport protein ExbB, partial [Paraglaciecola sp.]
MNSLLKKLSICLFVSLMTLSAYAQDNTEDKASDRALDLDALLLQLEQGKFQQNQQNSQRELAFGQKRAEQDQMLRLANTSRDQALNTSESLETQFEENEFKLLDLNDALTKRLGSLKELFGVLQQVAGDT